MCYIQIVYTKIYTPIDTETHVFACVRARASVI